MLLLLTDIISTFVSHSSCFEFSTPPLLIVIPTRIAKSGLSVYTYAQTTETVNLGNVLPLLDCCNYGENKITLREINPTEDWLNLIAQNNQFLLNFPLADEKSDDDRCLRYFKVYINLGYFLDRLGVLGKLIVEDSGMRAKWDYGERCTTTLEHVTSSRWRISIEFHFSNLWDCKMMFSYT